MYEGLGEKFIEVEIIAGEEIDGFGLYKEIDKKKPTWKSMVLSPILDLGNT